MTLPNIVSCSEQAQAFTGPVNVFLHYLDIDLAFDDRCPHKLLFSALYVASHMSEPHRSTAHTAGLHLDTLFQPRHLWCFSACSAVHSLLSQSVPCCANESLSLLLRYGAAAASVGRPRKLCAHLGTCCYSVQGARSRRIPILVLTRSRRICRSTSPSLQSQPALWPGRTWLQPPQPPALLPRLCTSPAP